MEEPAGVLNASAFGSRVHLLYRVFLLVETSENVWVKSGGV